MTKAYCALLPGARRTSCRDPIVEHLPQYFGLFGAAFLSATIFRFHSEVILFAMLMAEHHQLWLLITVASIGKRLVPVRTGFSAASLRILKAVGGFGSPNSKPSRLSAGTAVTGGGPSCSL